MTLFCQRHAPHNVCSASRPLLSRTWASLLARHCLFCSIFPGTFFPSFSRSLGRTYGLPLGAEDWDRETGKVTFNVSNVWKNHFGRRRFTWRKTVVLSKRMRTNPADVWGAFSSLPSERFSSLTLRPRYILYLLLNAPYLCRMYAPLWGLQ